MAVPVYAEQYVSDEERAMQDAEDLREAGDELKDKAIKALAMLSTLTIYADSKGNISVSTNIQNIQRAVIELDEAIARWEKIT